jgi:hypothetical protein
VLANASGGTGGDPCTTVTDTVQGAVGGAVKAVTGLLGGAATPADAAPAASSSGGGSGASLAFTGSATALLMLAGFGLVLSGAVLLALRRFGRRLV